MMLTILAAFAAAILSGMGVGSAGLFILYLTLIAGYPQQEAQAINLLFFLLSAGSALLLHIRMRRIPVRVVLFLLACAIPGALAGCLLVRTLDASLIRKLFGGMLVVTGLPGLLARRGKQSPSASLKRNKSR